MRKADARCGTGGIRKKKRNDKKKKNLPFMRVCSRIKKEYCFSRPKGGRYLEKRGLKQA